MSSQKNTASSTTAEAGSSAARFYDRMAEDYRNWSPSLHIHFGYFRWGMNPFDLESMLRRMTTEVMNRLAVSSKKPTILDAGCGVGAAARQMAPELPSAKFYGVTISQWQVDFGETRNREAGFSDRISLHRADFQATPFEDHAMDAAFAIESVCYAEGLDKAAFIREMSRVLKPGGRLVLVDGFRKHTRHFSAFFEKMYRRYLSLWALDDLADLQLFTEALTDHDFEKIEVEDVSWNVAPTVAHIPVVILKIWIRQRLLRRKKITLVQANYMRALALTLVMVFWKQHFSYCIVTCVKK